MTAISFQKPHSEFAGTGHLLGQEDLALRYGVDQGPETVAVLSQCLNDLVNFAAVSEFDFCSGGVGHDLLYKIAGNLFCVR